MNKVIGHPVVMDFLRHLTAPKGGEEDAKYLDQESGR